MNKSFEAIARDVEQKAFAVSDYFLPPSVSQQILADAKEFFAEGEFRKAKIGKGIEEQRITEIRSDQIHWLDKNDLTPALQNYWQQADALREYISNYFRLTLPWFESHLAVYPVGSFYKKHLDQFRETNNRLISFILYLNPDWKPEDDGQLRIYTEGKQLDIAPALGRLVCFRSDVIEHEVLPTTRPRYSVTAWMRRDEVPIEV